MKDVGSVIIVVGATLLAIGIVVADWIYRNRKDLL